MSPATAIRPSATDEDEQALADLVAEFYDDPLGWVYAAFPWGEPGTPLELEEGPDQNQIEFLTALGKEVRARGFDGMNAVDPIFLTEVSGHGTGKSAMGGWIATWIASTRPDSIGTVTAGTGTQLRTRTWAAVKYWFNLCITAHWFDVQALGIYHKTNRDSWKILPQTCRKENAQAFAGQHARTSTSWYLFDEASEVPDPIWTTAYGGLTDGEPMFFAWGQCVRNTGQFFEANYGREKARWNRRRVDSRSSRFTNKKLIAQWISDYGIDSDFVRVRVLGYAPKASELQFIDRARVDAARGRNALHLPADPLIAGFDVSGGGKAWNVIRFRKGYNGRFKDPIRLSGEMDPSGDQRVGICAELLNQRGDNQIAALFVDSAFGAPIVARLKMLGHQNVFNVNFGGDSPKAYRKNMRAHMYAELKEWLLLGSIPDDDHLCDQIIAPGYHINESGMLVLEPKESVLERMGADACMDDADALALTFAQPVAIREPDPRAQPGGVRKPKVRRSGWG